MADRIVEAAVLGAGVVGVCAALALRARGLETALVDRESPGSGVSYGNAGVLNRGSILPLNNPTLLAALPRLLAKRRAGFDYRLGDVLRRPLWTLRFLAECRAGRAAPRAAALDALIRRSAELYPALLAAAGASERLRQDGWLTLYRGAPPGAESFARRLLDQFGVAYEALGGSELRALEPALSEVFQGALWFRETAALDDPGATVRALAGRFADLGGQILRAETTHAEFDAGAGIWTLRGADGGAARARRLVIALGPWSAAWLRRVGLRAPLAFERGAHREFAPGPTPLKRPFHDVDGGYVLAPLAGRWRLTSGVELAEIDAPRGTDQLDAAEARLREAATPGARRSNVDWLGARPTLPDSLPAIGATRRPGLFIAIGHQHVGMATGPASGELLADLMLSQAPRIDPKPFAPARYGL